MDKHELDEKQYQKLRDRAITRLVLRWTWIINFVFSAVIILESIRSGDFPGALMPILIFSSGVILHGMVAFNLLDRMLDQAVEHEIKRYQQFEKPKRRSIEIGEDGELFERDVEQAEPEHAGKRLRVE